MTADLPGEPEPIRVAWDILVRMLHEVRASVDQYVRTIDRLIPGALMGFYVVGSAALGGYRPGRSDIDFVAVVRHEAATELPRRLRLLHIAGAATGALRAAREGQWVRTGSRNGVFVDESDLTLPATMVEPIATVVGTRCQVGGKVVDPVSRRAYGLGRSHPPCCRRPTSWMPSSSPDERSPATTFAER